MEIKELVARSYKNTVRKGFYDKPMQFGTFLMGVVSELGEALEADRNSNWGTGRHSVEEEIADAFIRLGSLCGYFGIDIEKQIEMKMKINNSREKLHGKRY